MKNTWRFYLVTFKGDVAYLHMERTSILHVYLGYMISLKKMRFGERKIGILLLANS